MIKNMKHIIKYTLMLFMVFSLSGCVSRNVTLSEDPKFLESIVEEIAVDYGTYGAEANDRIGKLLKDLTDADKVTGALIELFGDVETAFDIYYENYDIHGLPPLH